MQPAYHPLANIFGTQTRHLVPLFQRPYVWSREEQWEPLWEDIADLADRVLAGDSRQVAGHFLGTVVLEQAHTPSGAVNRREVIDGQQRLTTLQIVLQAAKLAFGARVDSAPEQVARAAQIERSRLDALTANPPGYDEEERYKVWPTNEDRAAFRQVMDAVHSDELTAASTRLAHAFQFFYGAVSNWLEQGELERRIPALSSALKDHLRLIVLDLDDSDEPQAIFETLNAHGTPLLPADLIKNWLLWQFARAGADASKPYESYWAPFDRNAAYWRQKVGTGHAARARIDMFLQSWLVRREGVPVSAKHLYDRFLKYGQAVNASTEAGATQLLEDIAAHGALFREIDEPTGRSRFHTLLARLKVMDMVVFQPVLLAILHRDGSDAADRDQVAIALESYLVRRLVVGAQTRGYGNLAIDLLRTISAVTPSQPVSAVVTDFLRSLGDALIWPGDERFRHEWCNRVFYGYFRRNRVLMILQAIEERLQTESHKAEPIVGFNFSSLTIEHLMPQKWQENWAFDGDERTRANRDRILHGIGNLTLVSGSLNPSLSNAAWAPPPRADGKTNSKATELRKHSRLQLNARLLEEWPSQWDEACIEARAKGLFNVAVEIWPGPATTAK